MRDYGSLSAHERRQHRAAISTTHWRRIELEVVTLNGAARGSLTNKFLGGSIQGDRSRTPVEILQGSVLDEDRLLDWQNGEHRKFRIRVLDQRFIPALNEWVEEEAFDGPLWDYARAGAVVDLTAQGCERLAMGSVRTIIDEPRKSQADAVIRKLLRATGIPDKALRVPNMKASLPERVTVGVRRGRKRPDGPDKDKKKEPPPKVQIYRATHEDSYWHEAASISAALNRQLYARGARFIVSGMSSRPIASLGPSELLAPVKETPGPTDGPNHWIILGADPKGPKRQIRVEVSLPKRHPLSPEALAWHGARYEITEVVENKQLRRRAAALRVGKQRRDAAMRETRVYEAEALPILSWIRPGSLISLTLQGGRKVNARINQWTIPLGPDASAMTLGSNRRVGL